ncbi:MAG: hypothetical protein ACKVOK_00340 [Flavobacteriales bacterium]
MSRNNSPAVKLPMPCEIGEQYFSKSIEGDYCSKCKEVVVDFTRMSSDEIRNHLRCNAKVKCGTFNESQLTDPDLSECEMVSNGRLASWSVLRFVAVFLLLLATVRSNSFVYESTSSYEIVTESESKEDSDTYSQVQKVKGRLLSSRIKHKGIKNVKVTDLSSGNWTVTDRNGFFELDAQRSNSDEVRIQFLDRHGESWERTLMANQNSDVVVFYKNDGPIRGKFMISDYE